MTAENDRGFNAATFGAGRFVLPVGQQFRAEYIGNNTIRIHDGKLMDNGAVAGIPVGEYVDLLIRNAGQGLNRNDLIVFQYEQDASTLIESGRFVVVQGTETYETASDPALTQADLLTGRATFDQMAMWRIPVSGATISAPVQLFYAHPGFVNSADFQNGLEHHNHSADDINAGILPIVRGGTGANNSAGILQNLHSKQETTTYIATFEEGWNNGGYCTPDQLRGAMGLGNGTSALAVANGGTGATSAASAREKLGAAPSDIFRNGTSNRDFNEITTPGWHWVQLGSCANTPFGDYVEGAFGFVEVIAPFGIDTDVMQRYVDYPTGKTYIRSSINGWQPWVRVDAIESLPTSGGTISGEVRFTNSTTNGDATIVKGSANELRLEDHADNGHTALVLSGKHLKAQITLNSGASYEDIMLANYNDYYRTWYKTVNGVDRWLFPPMLKNVEHCTTELHFGEPVYTMAVDCQYSADGKEVYHNVPIGKIVRSVCSIGNIPAKQMAIGETLPNHTYAQGYTIDTNKVTLYCNADRSGKLSYYQIWYTK